MKENKTIEDILKNFDQRFQNNWKDDIIFWEKDIKDWIVSSIKQ